MQNAIEILRETNFVLFVDINITLKIVFVNTKKDVFIANYLLRF